MKHLWVIIPYETAFTSPFQMISRYNCLNSKILVEYAFVRVPTRRTAVKPTYSFNDFPADVFLNMPKTLAGTLPQGLF